MNELLHVSPGTATPLALINDTAGAVTLIIDQRLKNSNQLNFHPMTHTESIGLSWGSFVRFCLACNHTLTTAELQTGPIGSRSSTATRGTQHFTTSREVATTSNCNLADRIHLLRGTACMTSYFVTGDENRGGFIVVVCRSRYA